MFKGRGRPMEFPLCPRAWAEICRDSLFSESSLSPSLIFTSRSLILPTLYWAPASEYPLQHWTADQESQLKRKNAFCKHQRQEGNAGRPGTLASLLKGVSPCCPMSPLLIKQLISPHTQNLGPRPQEENFTTRNLSNTQTHILSGFW